MFKFSAEYLLTVTPEQVYRLPGAALLILPSTGTNFKKIIVIIVLPRVQGCQWKHNFEAGKYGKMSFDLEIVLQGF